MQVLPELKLAGAQIMVENLSKELIKNGHVVEIVSLYSVETPLSERLKKNKVKVFFLGKKKGFDLLTVYKLRKLINEFNPEVIHTHTYSLKYAYLASLFLYKKQIIHTMHNIADKESSFLNKVFQKILFKNRVIPVAISPLVKKTVLSYYGLTEEQVPMIYNGIQLSSCVRKKSYYINKNNINIVHIGRLQEQKNHKLLIESIQKCLETFNGIKLHCYGDGPLKDTLMTLIKHYNLENNVFFEGITDNQFEVLNNADVFVLPSKWEGMPITLIEAMGTGLPIIATPVGGIPDMIENGFTGILCQDNSEELKNAILKIVSDQNLREKIGKNAICASERFSAEVMERNYELLYRDII